MPNLNGVQSVYVNVVQIYGGPFDVICDFGFSSPENRATGIPTDFDVVSRVVMSMGHAKSLLPILAKLISEYEEQFGPIPAPGFGEASRD